MAPALLYTSPLPPGPAPRPLRCSKCGTPARPWLDTDTDLWVSPSLCVDCEPRGYPEGEYLAMGRCVVCSGETLGYWDWLDDGRYWVFCGECEICGYLCEPRAKRGTLGVN